MVMLLVAIGQEETIQDEILEKDYSARMDGLWSLYFDDNENRIGDLKLNQVHETVFGVGNLTLNGTQRNVTAVGLVDRGDIDLSLVTSEGDIVLYLEFIDDNEFVTGVYHGISDNGSTIDGDIVMLGPRPTDNDTIIA